MPHGELPPAATQPVPIRVVPYEPGRAAHRDAYRALNLAWIEAHFAVEDRDRRELDDPERGRAAADRLGARFVPIDVASADSVARAAADITAHEGRVDVLINNAGIIGARLPAEQLVGPDAMESCSLPDRQLGP